MNRHDEDLAAAFDQQAADFERAPVQSDRVAFAALPPDAHILDCGCGPGLVAEAFLAGGYRVTGVDLSAEMVARARRRCARFEGRCRFERSSLSDSAVGADFDAAVSRSVLHHVGDPAVFIEQQRTRLRPGGILIAVDHTTDPEPARAAWHRDIELFRDRTHTRSLTAGAIVDLVAAAGFENVACVEEAFRLDFDEWFDRGTPSAPKEEVKARLLVGSARGFEPTTRGDGGVTISCWRALVRGEARDSR